MELFTTDKIDFANTRVTGRFDRVIKKGALITQIREINDRFSSFFTSSVLDKNGKPLEMYANTVRLKDCLSNSIGIV